MHDMELSGTVVLVTGAPSGIGQAAARRLAAQGARVALAARSVDALQTLSAEQPGSLVIPTDMLNEEAVGDRVTAEHSSRLAALGNNAGCGMHLPVEQASLDDYRQLFDLNVVSVLNATQVAVPIMRDQGGGATVSVSSSTIKTLILCRASSSSTKHALNNLSLIARAELARDGGVVDPVRPGMTATDFGRNSLGTPTVRGGISSQGDPAEYAGGLIVKAMQIDELDVDADSVRGRMISG